LARFNKELFVGLGRAEQGRYLCGEHLARQSWLLARLGRRHLAKWNQKDFWRVDKSDETLKNERKAWIIVLLLELGLNDMPCI
jgi:hypothetical protein